MRVWSGSASAAVAAPLVGEPFDGAGRATEFDDLEELEGLEELAGEMDRVAEPEPEGRQWTGTPEEAELRRKERELIKAIAANEASLGRLGELGELNEADAHDRLKQLKYELEKQSEEMMVIKDTLVEDKAKKKQAKLKAKEVRGRSIVPRVFSAIALCIRASIVFPRAATR